MNEQIRVGRALEQLQEVIAILRELGNAGPRNQNFKQWRQVTLTLLQRLWPDDQSRAVRFRRIPFSPPTARADAKTTKEHFARGCREALAYLDELVAELEARHPAKNLVRPPEYAPAESGGSPDQPVQGPQADSVSGEGPGAAVADSAPPAPHGLPSTAPGKPAPPAAPAAPVRDSYAPPAGPIEPSLWETPATADEARTRPPAPAPPTEDTRPGRPERLARVTPPVRQRLKDMLGFGDEPASQGMPAPPPAAAETRDDAGPTGPGSPVPPPPAPIARPHEPSGLPEGPQAGDPGQAPMDSPDPWTEPAEAFFDEEDPAEEFAPLLPGLGDDADGEALDMDPPAEEPQPEMPASPEAPTTSETLWEMMSRGVTPRPKTSRAAREVLLMAARVDQFGVPAQRRTIVRATLIDLGRQMDSPPVDWVAIRQALALVMDYPEIARRILPLLVPYLEEAA